MPRDTPSDAQLEQVALEYQVDELAEVPPGGHSRQTTTGSTKRIFAGVVRAAPSFV